MKTKSIVMIAVSLGLVGAASAEEGKPERPHHKMPPELLEKFDTNKDGKLDEAEREAAKAARKEMMKARKAEMLKKFDKDGDGKLSDDEEAAMREGRKKMMMEKFDKDGDGELSDDEKAEMRKSMGARPDGPRKINGKRRDGKERGRPKADGDKEAPGAGE